jgi:hypothetical protein
MAKLTGKIYRFIFLATTLSLSSLPAFAFDQGTVCEAINDAVTESAQTNNGAQWGEFLWADHWHFYTQYARF